MLLLRGEVRNDFGCGVRKGSSVYGGALEERVATLHFQRRNKDTLVHRASFTIS